MIGALSFCLAMQTQAVQLEKDPSVVVSKMLARYASAESLSGTIVQEVSDGGGKLKTTTQVKYIRPNYIFIEQDKKGRNGLNRKLLSDDTKFTYTPPDTTPVPPKPREMLFELRHLKNLQTGAVTALYIGDMYHAAHISLASTTLLDLAIAYNTHLKDFTVNVSTIQLSGMIPYQGQSVYRIIGTWRPYVGRNTETGYYELLVSQTFDALKFTLSETYSVQNRPVKLTITETADLKVGAEVDRSIFKVG